MMRIQTNVESLNAYRNLSETNRQQSQHMERLSSGYRINRAADDAAGLSISEQMRGQIGGLDQATENAQDATSLIQTAEGALNESHEILQRMRELSVQSANDTLTDTDRAEIQEEVDQLAQELTRISDTTEFNTQNLLDGDLDNIFHIGANEDQNISLSIDEMSAQELEVSQFDDPEDVDASEDDNAIIDLQTDDDIEAGHEIELSLEQIEEDDIDMGDFDFEEAEDLTVARDQEGEIVGYVDEDGLQILEDGTGQLTATADNNEFDGISEEVASDLENLDFDEGTVGTMMVEVTDVEDAGQEAAEVDLEFETGIHVADQEGADNAIETLDDAIETVSSQRSELGAVQNRLEHTVSNLEVASENLQAAESRIRDVDMASEMTDFTTTQILEEAGTAMLAQANQAPQNVLQLLG